MRERVAASWDVLRGVGALRLRGGIFGAAALQLGPAAGRGRIAVSGIRRDCAIRRMSAAAQFCLAGSKCYTLGVLSWREAIAFC